MLNLGQPMRRIGADSGQPMRRRRKNNSCTSQWVLLIGSKIVSKNILIVQGAFLIGWSFLVK